MTKEPKLTRDDFLKAIKERNTFVDVPVDELVEITETASKYAKLRVTETVLAGGVMSPTVVTTTADTSLAEATHLLVTHRISGLPVVDADGRLTGPINLTVLYDASRETIVRVFLKAPGHARMTMGEVADTPKNRFILARSGDAPASGKSRRQGC